MDSSALVLIEKIKSKIYENTHGDIDGSTLQDILIDIVNYGIDLEKEVDRIDASSSITYRYTINYNGNGATSGTMTQQVVESKSESATFVIKQNGYSRTGYTFNTFKTAQSGGTTYAPGSTVTLTKASPSITLYAQWTQDVVETYQYILSYDKNLSDASGNMNPQTEETSEKKCKFEILHSKYTYDEGIYKFLMWRTSPNGGDKYYPGDNITLTFDQPKVTLYAAYDIIPQELIEYSIVYDPKNGKEVYIDSSLSKREVINKPVRTIEDVSTLDGHGNFIYEGNTFKYWTDTKGVEYSPGTPVKLDKKNQSLLLRANWTPEEYTLTFGDTDHCRISASVDGYSVGTGSVVKSGSSVILTATIDDDKRYGIPSMSYWHNVPASATYKSNYKSVEFFMPSSNVGPIDCSTLEYYTLLKINIANGELDRLEVNGDEVTYVSSGVRVAPNDMVAIYAHPTVEGASFSWSGTTFKETAMDHCLFYAKVGVTENVTVQCSYTNSQTSVFFHTEKYSDFSQSGYTYPSNLYSDFDVENSFTFDKWFGYCTWVVVPNGMSIFSCVSLRGIQEDIASKFVLENRTRASALIANATQAGYTVYYVKNSTPKDINNDYKITIN